SLEAHRGSGAQRRGTGRESWPDGLEIQALFWVVEVADVLVGRCGTDVVPPPPQDQRGGDETDGRGTRLEPQRTVEDAIEGLVVDRTVEQGNTEAGQRPGDDGEHTDVTGPRADGSQLGGAPHSSSSLRSTSLISSRNRRSSSRCAALRRASFRVPLGVSARR